MDSTRAHRGGGIEMFENLSAYITICMFHSWALSACESRSNPVLRMRMLAIEIARRFAIARLELDRELIDRGLSHAHAHTRI